MTTPLELVHFLTSRRWTLSAEKPLQEEIAAAFEQSRIAFRREVALDHLSVVDFMVEATAIEVKIGGSRNEIFRQCTRYAAHHSIAALILATNVAMGLPRESFDKPIYVASLGRGWL